jgi:hypothetical protein
LESIQKQDLDETSFQYSHIKNISGTSSAERIISCLRVLQYMFFKTMDVSDFSSIEATTTCYKCNKEQTMKQ